MLIGGLAEIVSLGLIVPFLAFLVDPLKALEVPVVSMAANILGITESSYLRWSFTIFFAIARLFFSIVVVVDFSSLLFLQFAYK